MKSNNNNKKKVSQLQAILKKQQGQIKQTTNNDIKDTAKSEKNHQSETKLKKLISTKVMMESLRKTLVPKTSIINSSNSTQDSTSTSNHNKIINKNKIMKPVKPSIKQNKNSIKNNLSHLQEKMKAKLSGAQFRWINEKLYTSPSQDALSLMKEKPELFDVYHEGFRTQVKKWPLNPLSVMIDYISKQKDGTVVADMGCGEAELARTMHTKRPKMKVHSFDLVAANEFIQVCDIRKVPLINQSVDIVIFCLSLMGVNFMEFIQEARRILKDSGVLKIAEVESRFEEEESFISSVESVGFKLKQKDDKHKVFTLFEFEAKKVNSSDKKNDMRFNEQEKKTLLKPCLYKKR